jgi:hypothetical protein
LTAVKAEGFYKFTEFTKYEAKAVFLSNSFWLVLVNDTDSVFSVCIKKGKHLSDECMFSLRQRHNTKPSRYEIAQAFDSFCQLISSLHGDEVFFFGWRQTVYPFPTNLFLNSLTAESTHTVKELSFRSMQLGAEQTDQQVLFLGPLFWTIAPGVLMGS